MKTIGIAGCGGLGSNVAWLLVRSGFRNFVLADFDSVEESNLNRQFFFRSQLGQPKVEALRDNLLAIHPDLSLHLVPGRLVPGEVPLPFEDCDILVEALDRPDVKTAFIEAAAQTGKPLVAGSGLGRPGDLADIRLKWISPNFAVAGDQRNEFNPGDLPYAPGVLITASLMADAVAVLSERGCP